MNSITFIIIGGSLVVLVGIFFFLFFRRKINRSQKKAKNLATNLRVEQLKSDLIINAIQDAVVLIDEQKIIRVFNPAAAKMTGWSSEEAIGLDYHSVIRLINSKGSPYEGDADPFEVVFKTHKSVRDNSPSIISRNDSMLSISLSVSAIIEKDKVTAVIGVFRDITIERKQEQQRADFISTASHEMRTPIAAVEGYLSLALNDNVSTVDSRARTYLEKAHSSTQSLGQLFSDLLTSSKVEDGRLVSHPAIVEVSSLLSEVTGDLKFLAQKKGLIIEFVLGSGNDSEPLSRGKDAILSPLYYVYADPERLREVLVNLFDNAIKFSSEGKITFGVTGDDKIVQFYVKDQGAGIPEDDIPHLFQKFYRVDNSETRTVNGTGLGLFICRKIIELYQGRIWVESKPGKGSTFFINLPRISEQRISQLQGSVPPKSTDLS